MNIYRDLPKGIHITSYTFTYFYDCAYFKFIMLLIDSVSLH